MINLSPDLEKKKKTMTNDEILVDLYEQLAKYICENGDT